jgi:trimethylguanosine synthase
MSSRRRSNKRRRKHEVAEVHEVLSARERYWHRRHSLFSLFDLGVRLDEESWYSVTPEVLAKHHAERCRGRVIVDACCGVGGNAIQLAKTCERVIAVDVDPAKLEMGKENAAIYGVSNIEWRCGDFLLLADEFVGRADGVFVSPPWGGPSYIRQSELGLEDFPVDLNCLWNAARRVSRNVALFLPRNLKLECLRQWGETAEVESNFVNDRCLAVTVYFGGFIKAIG